MQIANLEIMGPPGPKEVMESSAKQVLRRLDNVDEDVKAFFMPAAEAVMATSDPKDAMCAALAALSGLLDVPKPRRCVRHPDLLLLPKVLGAVLSVALPAQKSAATCPNTCRCVHTLGRDSSKVEFLVRC